MKLFGYYITRINVDAHMNSNRGFAEEIEKLEAELDKYKQPRDSKSRFIKSEHIPDWGDLKKLVKWKDLEDERI